MQPTENQINSTKNSRVVHFIILGLAALGLLNFCIRYFDVKSDMTNPLIPKSLLHYVLTPYYYASGMYMAAIALQVLALYKPQLSRFSIITGAVLIAIAQLTERFYYQFFN
jgi:hypothetical protein